MDFEIRYTLRPGNVQDTPKTLATLHVQCIKFPNKHFSQIQHVSLNHQNISLHRKSKMYVTEMSDFQSYQFYAKHSVKNPKNDANLSDSQNSHSAA